MGNARGSEIFLYFGIYIGSVSEEKALDDVGNIAEKIFETAFRRDLYSVYLYIKVARIGRYDRSLSFVFRKESNSVVAVIMVPLSLFEFE